MAIFSTEKRPAPPPPRVLHSLYSTRIHFVPVLGGTENGMRNIVGVIILFMVLLAPLSAAERSIRVFIALCDNKTQGIIPVGAKIGDGDVPDENLYWGCDDGFGSVFKHNKEWTVLKAESDVSPIILRRITLKHRDKDAIRFDPRESLSWLGHEEVPGGF